MKQQHVGILFILLALLVASCASNGGGSTSKESTQAPAITTAAQSSSTGKVDVGGALNLVIGTSDRPSVYASYHLESTLTSPQASDDGKSVVQSTIQLKADVQGDKVHLFYTPSDSGQTKEGYIIGDKEYRVTNGSPEEMIGQIAMSWAGWHLGATFPFAAVGALAAKTGTDTVDGRTADVYSVDSSTIDPAVLDSFRTMGMFPIDTIKGSVWVDQQTGGALKAVADYTEDISDYQTDKVIGIGTGHLDLSITQIGQVTVESPE